MRSLLKRFTDHRLSQIRLVHRLCVGTRKHGFAAAHNRDSIGEPCYLTKTMRNEDHGLALTGHILQQREHVIGFVVGQHRGRLIENKNIGAE